MGCLWWWTSKKCDKHLGEEVKAIREDISASMDQLVASRVANEPYPELEQMCAYLQWTIDFSRFKEESKGYMQRMKDESKAMVDRARIEFREKNAMLREKILWDSCLIWLVLAANEEVFAKLPHLPWSLDSKC